MCKAFSSGIISLNFPEAKLNQKEIPPYPLATFHYEVEQVTMSVLYLSLQWITGICSFLSIQCNGWLCEAFFKSNETIRMGWPRHNPDSGLAGTASIRNADYGLSETFDIRVDKSVVLHPIFGFMMLVTLDELLVTNWNTLFHIHSLLLYIFSCQALCYSDMYPT